MNAMAEQIDSRARILLAGQGFPGQTVCEALVAVTLAQWPVDGSSDRHRRRRIRRRDEAIAKLRWFVGQGGWGSWWFHPGSADAAQRLWDQTSATVALDSDTGVRDRQVSPGAARCWAVVSLSAEAVRTALRMPWDSTYTAEVEKRCRLDNELIAITRSALKLAEKCTERTDAGEASSELMNGEWQALKERFDTFTAYTRPRALV